MLLGYSNQIKITGDLECRRDKEPVARQGFVPTVLKYQRFPCSMTQGYIIFSRSGRPKISLWCEQVIQNLAAQLVPCPVYTPAANLLQQKARVEVSAGLIASGETVTQLLFPVRMSRSCEQWQWGEQWPLQSPLGTSPLPKGSLFLHHLLLKSVFLEVL